MIGQDCCSCGDVPTVCMLSHYICQTASRRRIRAGLLPYDGGRASTLETIWIATISNIGSLQGETCQHAGNALPNPATRHRASDRKKSPGIAAGVSKLVELSGSRPLASTMPFRSCRFTEPKQRELSMDCAPASCPPFPVCGSNAVRNWQRLWQPTATTRPVTVPPQSKMASD